MVPKGRLLGHFSVPSPPPDKSRGPAPSLSFPLGAHQWPGQAVLGADLSGLEEHDVSSDTLRTLLAVDPAEWLREIRHVRQYYRQFGERLPAVLTEELDHLPNLCLPGQRTAQPPGPWPGPYWPLSGRSLAIS